MKKASFWLILLGFAFLLALIVGEVGLRLFDRAKGVTAPYTHNLPECLAVPNGYFNYDLEPNTSVVYDSKNPRSFTINQWGFRALDYNPLKPEGVKRIFTVGGSSTFDPYVGDEGTWSHLLGTKLNEAYEDSIECINAGRYGYTTSEIFGLVYHRILRHRPDLIVLYTTFNDSRKVISPYYGSDEYPQLYGNPLLAKLNKSSALFAFIDYRLRHVWKVKPYISLLPSHAYRKEPPIAHDEFLKDEKKALAYNLSQFERNISSIIDLCRKEEVELLLCTQLIDPSLAYSSPFSNKLMVEMTNKLREIALNDSIAILDMDSIGSSLNEEQDLLQTYVHFTPEGCEFMSERLSEKILSSGLLTDY